MYAPKDSLETRTDVLVDAMRAIRLGTFVTFADGAYHATHAPVVVSEADGATTLQTHFGRSNPHAGPTLDDAPSLVIFQGPHAYISPSFYPTKRDTGKVVPTWLYIAVHGRGRLTRRSETDWLEAHLHALTATHEAPRETPWAVTDAPGDYLRRMRAGIVGIELVAETLSGAWKLNQHKGEADFDGTREGLAAEPDNDANAIAAAMASLRA